MATNLQLGWVQPPQTGISHHSQLRSGLEGQLWMGPNWLQSGPFSEPLKVGSNGTLPPQTLKKIPEPSKFLLKNGFDPQNYGW